MSIVPGVVASTKCVSKLSQRGQLWVGRSISRRPPTRARYTWHPLAVFYSVVPEAGTRFLIPGSPTALIAPFATNPGKTFGIFYAGCRVRMIMLRDCDTLRHFVHLALEKVFESGSTQAQLNGIYQFHSDFRWTLNVTNQYLQAASKTKHLAHDKLVDAILPSGLLSASKSNLIQ